MMGLGRAFSGCRMTQCESSCANGHDRCWTFRYKKRSRRANWPRRCPIVLIKSCIHFPTCVVLKDTVSLDGRTSRQLLADRACPVSRSPTGSVPHRSEPIRLRRSFVNSSGSCNHGSMTVPGSQAPRCQEFQRSPDGFQPAVDQPVMDESGLSACWLAPAVSEVSSMFVAYDVDRIFQ